MSFVGNCGTFTRGYKAMIMDVEFLYHLLYLLICALGLFVHEFFYSLLVGVCLALRASSGLFVESPQGMDADLGTRVPLSGGGFTLHSTMLLE